MASESARDKRAADADSYSSVVFFILFSGKELSTTDEEEGDLNFGTRHYIGGIRGFFRHAPRL